MIVLVSDHRKNGYSFEFGMVLWLDLRTDLRLNLTSDLDD